MTFCAGLDVEALGLALLRVPDGGQPLIYPYAGAMV